MTEQQWRPISTALKDGSEILLHVDWEPLTVVGYWGEGRDSLPISTDDGSAQWRVKWDQSRIAPGFDEPTHWAPIPKGKEAQND